MKIRYGLTGAARKELVKTIADRLDTRAKYLGMPTCAYSVGGCTVDKEGTLLPADWMNEGETEMLIEYLLEEGFIPTAIEHEETVITVPDNSNASETAEKPTESDTAEQVPDSTDTGAITDLTVTLPYDGFDEASLGRLDAILMSKGALLKKAIGIEELPVDVTETEVRFPWFKGPMTPDEAQAYIHLVAALCSMAKNQKRITAKEKTVENEKYALRCFLLRLGFIGDGFKTYRKILLRNMEGSSAFRTGAKKEASADE